MKKIRMIYFAILCLITFTRSVKAQSKNTLERAIYQLTPGVEYGPLETDISETEVKFFNDHRCKIYPSVEKPSDLEAAKADDKAACESKISELTKTYDTIETPAIRSAYIFTLVNNYHYLTLILGNEKHELSKDLPQGYRSTYFVSGEVVAYEPQKKIILLSGYAEAYYLGAATVPKNLTSNHPDPQVYTRMLPVERFLTQDVTPVRLPSIIGIVHAKSPAKPKQNLKLFGLHFVQSDSTEAGESMFIFTPVVPPNFAKRMKEIAAVDKQLIKLYTQIRKHYSEYEHIDRRGLPRLN